MITGLRYTIAVTVALLVAAIITPGVATANCGSCGPAVIEAAPAPGKTCPSTKTCKSGCARAATAKACPSKKACKSGCNLDAAAKACPVGCAKPCCAKKAAEAETAEVGTHALEALLGAKAAVTILDARSGKWDDGRRIPGAKSLSPTATAEQAAEVIPSKDSLVVTYCAGVQCPASGRLATTLQGLGYKNILEYPAGIAGWVEHGNPTEQVK